MVIIKLYKTSFIVHYHCSILTHHYLLMHCNCKSWAPPHRSLTIWSYLVTVLGRNVLSLVFMQRQWPVFFLSTCRVSHKHWKWVVGGFSMGCRQLIYNSCCKYADVPPGSQEGSGIPLYKQPGHLKTCSGTWTDATAQENALPARNQ